MTQVIIDTAGSTVRHHDAERLGFLETARSHLAVLDANSFQPTDREEMLTCGTHLLRVDGSRRNWNRITMFQRDESNPTVNVVLPTLLAGRTQSRTRFDAARTLMSLAVAISENQACGREDDVARIRDVVGSATLAASAASGRPISALLPTPWWPCMEHWSLRTRPEGAVPRGGPIDDFLAEVGTGLEGVIEAEWRTTEGGRCRSFVALAASCGTKRAEEDPVAAMRAVERWRPTLERAGLS